MRVPGLSRIAEALGMVAPPVPPPGSGGAGPPVRRGQAGHDAEEARRAGRRRARRTARAVAVAGGAAAFLAVVAVGVFPTRTWLDQRSTTTEVEQRLEVLRDQNAAFEERLDRLDSDAEIERLAREQYNLVLPGEEAYAVLPPPLPPLEPLDLWPFGPLIGD